MPATGDIFVRDTFTAPNGTLLANHTGEGGSSWIRYHGYDSTASLGEIFNNKAVHGAYLMPTASSYSDEYDIEADVYYAGASTFAINLFARWQESGRAGYRISVGRTSLTVYLVSDSGGITALGSYNRSVTSGQTENIRVEVRDEVKILYLNGVALISTSDNVVSQGRRVGFQAPSSNSRTSGTHIDNFTATDVALATVTVSTNATISGTSIAAIQPRLSARTSATMQGTSAVAVTPGVQARTSATIAGTSAVSAQIKSISSTQLNSTGLNQSSIVLSALAPTQTLINSLSSLEVKTTTTQSIEVTLQSSSLSELNIETDITKISIKVRSQNTSESKIKISGELPIEAQITSTTNIQIDTKSITHNILSSNSYSDTNVKIFKYLFINPSINNLSYAASNVSTNVNLKLILDSKTINSLDILTFLSIVPIIISTNSISMNSKLKFEAKSRMGEHAYIEYKEGKLELHTGKKIYIGVVMSFDRPLTQEHIDILNSAPIENLNEQALLNLPATTIGASKLL